MDKINPQLQVPQLLLNYTKEIKQLIQIMKADHLLASEEFNFLNFFQKDKYFKSNDISKTQKFYEFILMDTKSVQISYIKNTEGIDIAYSKCKILKFISEKD